MNGLVYMNKTTKGRYETSYITTEKSAAISTLYLSIWSDKINI